MINIHSIDGLWKTYDNSFMIRIKTLDLSEYIENVLRFSANAELAGGCLPFAIDLIRALKDIDLYAVMPSRPEKCLTVTSCDMPTITGGCVIYGWVANAVKVQSTDSVGRYDNRPDKKWGAIR